MTHLKEQAKNTCNDTINDIQNEKSLYALMGVVKFIAGLDLANDFDILNDFLAVSCTLLEEAKKKAR